MFSNYFASGGGANQDPYAYPQQPPGGDVPQQQPPQQQQQQQQEQQQYQSEGGQYPTQEQCTTSFVEMKSFVARWDVQRLVQLTRLLWQPVSFNFTFL